ncbi:hypothetical protein [Gloeocapsa sp. PCC 73106]|uniref:hypothetical protein n=1 Tax=Gloeocapsa sp. PCC 73106 TaxID=102232 RepID=UPI0002AD0552|nr:hypothetical protein [Gloeocapsa sp. PCC 73106]ELR96563.1 hypothetical protein GLO73106DRAFT_00003580 [Gloeocapsa sp. PCC 73106]
MKIEKPNSQPPSREELENLDKLKVLIERCVADGTLSLSEMELIKAFIKADGKISTEELDLCRQLIWDKIEAGELEYDWTPKN